jgi:hypothetical protein
MKQILEVNANKRRCWFAQGKALKGIAREALGNIKQKVVGKDESDALVLQPGHAVSPRMQRLPQEMRKKRSLEWA